MSTVNEQRMEKIRQRCRQYRRRYENRQMGTLSFCCAFLIWSIFVVLHEVNLSGSLAVTGSYSSVVLHSGGGGYVFVGIAAFAAGVTITVLCIRYGRSREQPSDREKEDL